MTDEKQRFLSQDWPRIRANIARLGLSLDDLLSAPPASQKKDSA